MNYSLYDIVRKITTDTRSFEQCINEQIKLISCLFDDLLSSFSEDINDEETQDKIKDLLFNKVLEVIKFDELEGYLTYRSNNVESE